jgi:serine/threonine-protein kinase HipA
MAAQAQPIPAWIWLPGAAEPVLAAQATLAPGAARWAYSVDYLSLPGALAPDPVALRLSRKAKGLMLPVLDGLPGVVRDAMPAGYGADRLCAAAGRPLASAELLELGPADGVGGLELCHNIARKLAWAPHAFEALGSIMAGLDEGAPASRAVRLLHDDAATSAGGERPKVTVQHRGGLWLAKMQDRGDLPAMPAREFAVMSLAAQVGLSVPPIELHAWGHHQVFLIQRFDRAGDPARPQRKLFASAHTVLGLSPAATRSEPERSYLVLADRMRIWCAGNPLLAEHLAQLWQRMAFNALVGNVDDHPRNHGLLHDGVHWGLSPVFDVTPVLRQAQGEPLVGLAMATGVDGSGQADAARLLACCGHFGLGLDEAAAWLKQASEWVAAQWAPQLRLAGAKGLASPAALDALLADCRPAFALSEALASCPGQIDEAHAAAARTRASRSRVAASRRAIKP